MLGEKSVKRGVLFESAQCGVALTCDRDAEEDSALVAPYFGFTVIRRELATLPIHLLYSWHQATLVPFNPSAE